MPRDCNNHYYDTSPIMQAKRALKNILQKCIHLPALEPLLHDAPPNILKHVVGQFSKVLPHDPHARRLFVTSGGLKKVQEIKAEPGSALHEYINIINNCFPEEIVRYVCLHLTLLKVVGPICSLKIWDKKIIMVCRSKYHVGTLFKN